MLRAWIALALCAAPLAAQERPNILFVYADDLAQRAISCYGGIAETPNIDRLAAQGVRFSHSFVGNSICGPARGTVLTGLHSHAHGKTTNPAGFDDSLPTFATELSAAGYQTAVVGKWHLPTNPRGFDHWRLTQGSYYAPGLRGPDGVEPRTGYATDIIVDEALRWLEEDRDPEQPFCLWVSHIAAHRTWMPATRYLSMYEEEALPEPVSLLDDYAGRSPGAEAAQMRIARDLFPAYDLKLPVTGEGILDRNAEGLWGRMSEEERAAWDAAYGPRNAAFAEAGLSENGLVHWQYQRYIKDYLRCVAAIDDALGRMLRFLDENALRDNTVVVFTSDQGFFLGEHGWYDKRWIYEPAFATPWIVSWPGVTPAGLVRDELVQNIDLAPTLLGLAGVSAVESMHGMDVSGLLRSPDTGRWRDAVYYHYMQRDSGRTSHTVAPHYGLRTARHKLVYVYDHEFWELYDLHSDPHELHNLAGDPAQAEQLAALQERLRALRLQFGDEQGPGF